ncbi:Uncharacterized protein Y057_9014 [Fusarium fujikuroi]|nr:Uncharacterized protein Y057_9014 [Fusarium fujikuroi]
MYGDQKTIFKLVGRFNIQGGVIKQALATDILCKNGLRPFDHKNHDIKDIGILVISEAEYNKPSEFLEPVRDSGGRLVKKKWIEDLHFKRTWLDTCGDYLWEKLGCVDDKDVSGDDKYKWQDDDYEQGDDDDDESDDDDYERKMTILMNLKMMTMSMAMMMMHLTLMNLASMSLRLMITKLMKSLRSLIGRGLIMKILRMTTLRMKTLRMSHIGRKLKKVVDKIRGLLGEGGYGTVVRACKVVRDCEVPESKDVAIKISAVGKGRSNAARKEFRILETIKMNDEKNQKGCIRVQECFEYRGHICMVMDLLGQSTCEFLEQNNYLPYPKGHIQSFARQLFNSVACIVHADIKPENLVLCDHTYCTLPYHRVRPSSSFVRSQQARYAAERRVLNNTEVRLIDFGIATFMDEPPSHFDSTAPYCAPEAWIYHKASFSQDIWSIGCTLVEFFTGDILFDADDMTEYIAMTEAVTGLKFEEEISWITDERFRHILSALLPNAMQKPRQRVQRMSMKHVHQIIAPGDDPFLKDFADLLKRIFVLNPDHRITAKQALQHPCLTEIAQPDDDTLAAEPNSASNLATP